LPHKPPRRRHVSAGPLPPPTPLLQTPGADAEAGETMMIRYYRIALTTALMAGLALPALAQTLPPATSAPATSSQATPPEQMAPATPEAAPTASTATASKTGTTTHHHVHKAHAHKKTQPQPDTTTPAK